MFKENWIESVVYIFEVLMYRVHRQFLSRCHTVHVTTDLQDGSCIELWCKWQPHEHRCASNIGLSYWCRSVQTKGPVREDHGRKFRFSSHALDSRSPKSRKGRPIERSNSAGNRTVAIWYPGRVQGLASKYQTTHHTCVKSSTYNKPIIGFFGGASTLWVRCDGLLVRTP